MHTLRFRKSAFCLLLLPGFTQSAAQVVSCHLEYSREHPRFTRITLVNDSEKTLEAFQLIQRCGRNGGSSSGDIFDFSETSTNSMHAADGAILRGSGLGLGDKWDASFLNSVGTGSAARICDPELTAILFADGTYEGNDDTVRATKAARDGIRDSVIYWAEKFAREDPANPNIEAIHAEAQDRVNHDRSETDTIHYRLVDDPEPPLHGYWRGRSQVDTNIELWTRPNVTHYTVTHQWGFIANVIDRWKKKIADDQAMKILDAQFPPVSPGKPTGNETSSVP